MCMRVIYETSLLVQQISYRSILNACIRRNQRIIKLNDLVLKPKQTTVEILFTININAYKFLQLVIRLSKTEE